MNSNERSSLQLVLDGELALHRFTQRVHSQARGGWGLEVGRIIAAQVEHIEELINRVEVRLGLSGTRSRGTVLATPLDERLVDEHDRLGRCLTTLVDVSLTSGDAESQAFSKGLLDEHRGLSWGLQRLISREQQELA